MINKRDNSLKVTNPKKIIKLIKNENEYIIINVKLRQNIFTNFAIKWVLSLHFQVYFYLRCHIFQIFFSLSILN